MENLFVVLKFLAAHAFYIAAFSVLMIFAAANLSFLPAILFISLDYKPSLLQLIGSSIAVAGLFFIISIYAPKILNGILFSILISIVLGVVFFFIGAPMFLILRDALDVPMPVWAVFPCGLLTSAGLLVTARLLKG